MARKGSSRKANRMRHSAAYATAAGAAMAVAGPAQAAVHWSGPKDIVVNRDNPVVILDLNGDGISDFGFGYAYGPLYGSVDTQTTYDAKYFTLRWQADAYARGIGLLGYQTGNSAVGNWFYWPGFGYVLYGSLYGALYGAMVPYRLGQDDPISSGMPGYWDNGGLVAGLGSGDFYFYLRFGSFYTYDGSYFATTFSVNLSGTHSAGNFMNEKGFIGVRFQIDGAAHYGWIEFEGLWNPPVLSPGGGDQGSVSDGNTQSYPLEGTITGWAYEDVAERPIVAGDRGEPTSVPTLNTWGMMFLAALVLMEGARRLRKGREQG